MKYNTDCNLLVRQIAVLSEWKRDMTEKGLFSVKELVLRCNQIEQALHARLQRLATEPFYSTNTHPGHASREKPSTFCNDHVVRKITQVFAQAAGVYLNVLVSGPNPDIPEVSQGVKNTLAALKELPEPKYLRHAVWPFCIAGCMATKDWRQSFRDLASGAGIHLGIFGTAGRAMEVMETCWKIRDEGVFPIGCDWLDAMNWMGQRILLI